jgi:hypothetical protein
MALIPLTSYPRHIYMSTNADLFRESGFKPFKSFSDGFQKCIEVFETFEPLFLVEFFNGCSPTTARTERSD